MTNRQLAELGGQLRQNAAYKVLRRVMGCTAVAGMPLILTSIWLSATQGVPAEVVASLSLLLCLTMGLTGARLARIEEVYAYKILRRSWQKPCAATAWVNR